MDSVENIVRACVADVLCIDRGAVLMEQPYSKQSEDAPDSLELVEFIWALEDHLHIGSVADADVERLREQPLTAWVAYAEQRRGEQHAH
jgi:acyl carrier protein